MALTQKDKAGYFFFQVAIVIVYLLFLILPPLVSILESKEIKTAYDPEYFKTLLASVRSDAEKELLCDYYQLDTNDNTMKSIKNFKLKDRLRINLILKRNNKAVQIRFGLYFLILITLYTIRYLIALFYKDKKIDPNFLPTVAVIIPVKNEEKYIFKTIEHCYENGYPLDQLEVIVINDGSTDKTLSEIKRAKKCYPSLKYKSFQTNSGKRLAIAAAVKMTQADYFVMLDSDTLLSKNAIQQILQHFSDPKVAAISGHTKVANLNENILTKAQGFKYFCSYRLFKAFEGVFGTVVCAPGCFSAYRANKFREIMEEWHSKTFFGRRCVAGEDRALTTLLLRKNKIKYSNEAVAYTYVPTTLKSFAIQQKRWMRSWFRESLYVARFIWKKNPLPAISFYVMLFISTFAPITLFRECFIMPFLLLRVPWFYLVSLFVIIFTQAFFCLLTKQATFFFYGFIFSILYFLFLIWLIPISIFTITSGNWGSRGAVYFPVNSTKSQSKLKS